MWREEDIKQFEQKEISIEKVEKQIENFKAGFPYLDIKRPATIGDGILKLDEIEMNEFIKLYETQLPQKKVVKFVPASGAASRMFKSLFSFLEKVKKDGDTIDDTIFVDEKDAEKFFTQIDKFAFYDDLKEVLAKKGTNIESLIKIKNYAPILEALLTDAGLNYGGLPKGLLKFHNYENTARTPIEEHLVEGANYCSDKNGLVRIHLTVSPEHRQNFNKKIDEVKNTYENKFDVKFDISFSIQKPSTDTMAVDMNNNPFRLDNGQILFRPGGHGALIENLNDLDADVVFIKNIDNVVPDKLKATTYEYKKAIAGVLLNAQQQTFNYLTKLQENITEELISEIENFAKNTLLIELTDSYAAKSTDQKAECLKAKLNRPIRVCGMVKNEGEPGGGPFWATNPDQTVSLQVVETSQIDPDSAEKQEIVKKASHFNPVDLVCGIKDSNGNKFDLLNYVDKQTGFISKKSKSGKELKAQELPGLWNGAMSDWNTIFVEVPVITFNPVKKVIDLLRDQHQ